MFIKWRGETRVQSTEQPRGKPQVEKFQYFRKDILTLRNT